MADANVNKVSMTEKLKVKEITDKLEEGLKELLSTVEGYEDFKQAVMNPCYRHQYSYTGSRSG